MQSYTTIIGVIELRLQKQTYDIVQKRFGIGSSTVTSHVCRRTITYNVKLCIICDN